MATSSSIFLSISEHTVPGKRRFLNNTNLNLHYRLDIGILDDDADNIHDVPRKNPLTIAQAVEVMKKKHPGLDILEPLRKARAEIKNYVNTKVFTPFSESKSISAFSAMRRYRGKPMFSTVYSDDGYEDFIGINHDIIGSGKTVRKRLEDYGKYWVDIIREYILGLDFQLSDKTIETRKWKEEHYPGIYSYPLGIDQPAVETGLVFNSIKYKVTNLSSDRELQRIHSRWKKEGLRKSSEQKSREDSRRLAKKVDEAGFEELTFYEMTRIGGSNRTVPALNASERNVLRKIMEKFGTRINRRSFIGLKSFIAQNSRDLKSAEKIMIVLPTVGYEFVETSAMVMSDGMAHEGGFRY